MLRQLQQNLTVVAKLFNAIQVVEITWCWFSWNI